MKRLFLTLMCLSVIYSSFAQVNEQHLQFMGIPINGTPEEFGSKLKEKGFKYNSEHQSMSTYIGDFANHSGCIVGVCHYNNLVVSVIVDLGEKDYLSYSNLKSNLTQKYGQPKHIIESNYEDGHKACSAEFSLPTGGISLQMSGHIIIMYTDKCNMSKRLASANNDL